MTEILGSPIGGDGPSGLCCSRAGCEAAASDAIRWRNPKIHPVERRKTWLACAEHSEFLRNYLTERSFPVEVVPVAELSDAS